MTPLAKGIRTFAALSVGVLGTAALYDWSQDARVGAITLGLGLLSCALGGLVAALYAAAGKAASTPVGKAFNTLWQGLASGLATVAFNSVADLTAFPRVFWPIVVGAVLGAIQTLAQTSAEAGTG